MLTKIEHIGIAVRDIYEGNKRYEQLLGVPHYKQEEVTSEKVMTSFFKVGETKIELLAATDESSTIHKYIEKRGEGIHHMAYHVDDIHATIERLEKEGFRVIVQPKPGADNKIIAFLHPKDSTGVLTELCMPVENL